MSLMKNIVVLVDLSDLAFKVLKQAHFLAVSFKSRVVILHVVPKEPAVVQIGMSSPVILQDPPPERVHQHHARLIEMRDSLVKYGVDAVVRQLVGASAESVLEETRRLGADLIILGSHHHGTIYHLLVGSMADEVLKHARCPVLVVPGDEPAQAPR